MCDNPAGPQKKTPILVLKKTKNKTDLTLSTSTHYSAFVKTKININLQISLLKPDHEKEHLIISAML